jgi:pilus assembly protein CpaE
MNALILSHTLVDPIAQRLNGLLRARNGFRLPATESYESFGNGGAYQALDLAIVILAREPDRGLELLRHLRQGMGVPVLAVGQVSDPMQILRALQNGAEYYLNQEELEKEFETGLSRFKFKQVDSAPAGRLLAVLSASGGTGASTLAANIATVLAKDEQKCVLMDLKPGRGDLAALLDLKPTFTLADLCQNVNRLDRTMFEKMLVRHTSGVCLIGSPQLFQDIKRVTAAGVGQGISLARTFFPCTVVDTEDCFHDEQLVVLREADNILLTIRLDFTSLRNARRILEHLQDLGIAANRTRLVVSRFGQANELPADEAEDALGRKIQHFIPEDSKTVNGCNNSGVPVVLRAPNSKVSQAIAQLARACTERRRANVPA